MISALFTEKCRTLFKKSIVVSFLTAGVLFAPAVFAQDVSAQNSSTPAMSAANTSAAGVATAVPDGIPDKLQPLARELGCNSQEACRKAFEDNFEQGIKLAEKHNVYSEEQKSLAASFQQEVLNKLTLVGKENFEETLLQVAKDILSKKPELAKKLEVQKEVVQTGEKFIARAKAVGVNFNECQNMDPDSAPIELLRGCARLVKDKEVQKFIELHSPEDSERRGPAGGNDFELTAAIRSGNGPKPCVQKGITDSDACGREFSDAVTRGDEAAVKEFKNFGRQFGFSDTEIDKTAKDFQQFAQGVQKQLETVNFTTEEGTVLFRPEEIGRYVEGQAKRGNVAAVEKGLDFMVANGFVSSDDKAFALQMVQKVKDQGGQVDFNQCAKDPKACERFVPDERKGDFAAMTRVEGIMKVEMQKVGVPDPRLCEDPKYGDQCVKAAKAALPQLEALSDQSPLVKNVITDIRQHIKFGEEGTAARGRVEVEFQRNQGVGIKIGDQTFNNFQEVDAFCRTNGQLCLAESAKQGFVNKDFAAEKFEQSFEKLSPTGPVGQGQQGFGDQGGFGQGGFQPPNFFSQPNFGGFGGGPGLFGGQNSTGFSGGQPYPGGPGGFPFPGQGQTQGTFPGQGAQGGFPGQGFGGPQVQPAQGGQPGSYPGFPGGPQGQQPYGGFGGQGGFNQSGFGQQGAFYQGATNTQGGFDKNAALEAFKKWLDNPQSSPPPVVIFQVPSQPQNQPFPNQPQQGQFSGPQGQFGGPQNQQGQFQPNQQPYPYPQDNQGQPYPGGPGGFPFPGQGQTQGTFPGQGAQGGFPGQGFGPQGQQQGQFKPQQGPDGQPWQQFPPQQGLPSQPYYQGQNSTFPPRPEGTSPLYPGTGFGNCGNGTCDGGEDFYSCASDCPVRSYEDTRLKCTDGVDNDNDNLIDQADPSCSGITDDPTTTGGCTSELVSLLGAGCHKMYDAYFDGPMSKYAPLGTVTVKSCSDSYAAGCSNTPPAVVNTVCDSQLTSLLGSGCHYMDISQAFFNGLMDRFVMPNTTTIKLCSAEYRNGCTVSECPRYGFGNPEGSRNCNTTACPSGCAFDDWGCPLKCAVLTTTSTNSAARTYRNGIYFGSVWTACMQRRSSSSDAVRIQGWLNQGVIPPPWGSLAPEGQASTAACETEAGWTGGVTTTTGSSSCSQSLINLLGTGCHYMFDLNSARYYCDGPMTKSAKDGDTVAVAGCTGSSGGGTGTSYGTNHTWRFKDGSTQYSQIKSDTSASYLAFIAQKDAEATAGYFNGWASGAGTYSDPNFGVPLISSTPTGVTSGGGGTGGSGVDCSVHGSGAHVMDSSSGRCFNNDMSQYKDPGAAVSSPWISCTGYNAPVVSCRTASSAGGCGLYTTQSTCTSVGCAWSASSTCVPLSSTTENCSNGVDDDGDGWIDSADPGCGGSGGGGTTWSQCTAAETSALGSGCHYMDSNVAFNSAMTAYYQSGSVIQCSSTWRTGCSGGTSSGGCSSYTSQSSCTAAYCAWSASSTCVPFSSATENCSNGVDDDGDGWVDGADPGCGGTVPSGGGSYEDTQLKCSDGTDNDGDGLIDLADPGCSSYTTTTTTGSGTTADCSTKYGSGWHPMDSSGNCFDSAMQNYKTSNGTLYSCTATPVFGCSSGSTTGGGTTTSDSCSTYGSGWHSMDATSGNCYDSAMQNWRSSNGTLYSCTDVRSFGCATSG